MEGEHNLKVKIMDKKGNFTESEFKNLKIDKTKPLAPASVNSPAISYSNVNTPLISGTGEPGCVITIKEGNLVLGTTTVDIDNSWATNLTASVDGIHNISITQTDSALNTSDETPITLKIDTVGPLGEINIRENKFTTFLNKITFGMFFKDTIDVTFDASDENGSGVKTIEYLKVNSEFQTKEEAIASSGWTQIPIGSAFRINSNNNHDKFIIYPRITDNAGNITCINSNGVIVYTDSNQSTSEMIFTKTHTTNLKAVVNLNGNTVKTIFNGSQELSNGSDYQVNGSQIEFKPSYLDSLPVDKYSLTVYYNPAGIIYNQSDYNSAPLTTSINLSILKAAQNPFDIVGLNSSYTYGDDPLEIFIDSGNESGVVSFVSSDESVAKISSNTVKILKVGTFKITATKASE